MWSRIAALIIARSIGGWFLRLLIGLGLAVATPEGVVINPVVGLFLAVATLLVWVGLIISSAQAIYWAITEVF